MIDVQDRSKWNDDYEKYFISLSTYNWKLEPIRESDKTNN